jgi:hypothetical protein
MKKKANIYICSKPLQYINLTNIDKSFNCLNILFIENNFINAESFYKIVVEYDKTWDKIFFINNGWIGLITHLIQFKIEKIFYYLDCYLVPSILFNCLIFRELYIYDEGLGTYTHIMHEQTFFKKIINRYLGVPSKPGFHRKVNGIYVYAPKFYLSINENYLINRTINSFNLTFQENLKRYAKLFEVPIKREIEFIYNINNKKIGFYIASWNIDYDFLESINFDIYDNFYIKTHPHNKKINTKLYDFKKISVIHSSILVEVILQILLDNENEIDVFHYDSSSMIYFSQIPNKFNIYNFNKEINYLKTLLVEISAEVTINS